MARQYKCISGDGHIDLNPDIWRDRVQAKYRDRAPKVITLEDGTLAVLQEGLSGLGQRHESVASDIARSADDKNFHPRKVRRTSPLSKESRSR